MTHRIAATLALVAFTVCILVGLQAGNTFSTIVSKALVALAVTFGVGLVLGAMAQKMLDENLAPAAKPKNSSESQAKPEAGDR